MMLMHQPPRHILFHGGDMESILMEWELGERVAFDLFHSDDVMFCYCGLAGECWFCVRGRLP